jgi:hypothetical protein
MQKRGLEDRIARFGAWLEFKPGFADIRGLPVVRSCDGGGPLPNS